MGKLYYTKGGSYTLPAGNTFALNIDGLYIDSSLFENNIPLIDATLHVRVSPDSRHDCFYAFTVDMPVFDGNLSWSYAGASWMPHESGERSFDVLSNGHPYGVGLYAFGIFMEITSGIPITRNIIFYVAYEMEVDI